MSNQQKKNTFLERLFWSGERRKTNAFGRAYLPNQSGKSTFFGGVAILSAGILLVKLLGAIYRIPLIRMLPNTSVAAYNGAYNIYSFFLNISTAGLPVALSKMVSEARTAGRYNQMRQIFRTAVLTFLTMGIVSFLGMSVFAQVAADVVLENSDAVYCVMALSPSVLCVCVIAAFRGYNQGRQNMMPSATSQIIEAAGKVIVGLALVFYFVKAVGGDAGADQAAVGALVGVSVGSMIALLYMLIYHKRNDRSELEVSGDVADSASVILKRLLALAIPITLGASSIGLVTLLDGKLTMMQLKDLLGTEDAAKELFGLYQSTMPIYNLPASLMIPITASVIPAVSAAVTAKNRKQAGTVSESALRIGYLMAAPMGVGLFVLGGPICEVLLKREAALAGPLLSVLGLASICVCLYTLSTSILQSNGFVYLPVVSVIIGGVAKICSNLLLVGRENINIYGAPVGTLVCFLIATMLNLLFIKRVVPGAPKYYKVFPKVTIATAVMGLGAWAVYGLLDHILPMSVAMLGAIAVAVVIYVVLVIFLQIFTMQDIQLMPKGDKIAKILRINIEN